MKLPDKKSQEKMLAECMSILDFEWTRAGFIFPKIKAFNKPEIMLNNRLRSCGGMYFPLENKIEINTKLMFCFPVEFEFVVIPHELCHMIDFALYGEPKVKHGHGKTWNEIMVKFGQKPERFLPVHVKL